VDHVQIINHPSIPRITKGPKSMLNSIMKGQTIDILKLSDLWDCYIGNLYKSLFLECIILNILNNCIERYVREMFLNRSKWCDRSKCSIWFHRETHWTYCTNGKDLWNRRQLWYLVDRRVDECRRALFD
jgi:hypothetical protein